MSLIVQNLNYEYENFKLKNINLQLKGGNLYGLLGANASGKSTFFNCVMRILNPNEGNIYINNENIANKTSSWMAKQISYVAQNHHIDFGFSVYDLVAMGRYVHKKSIFGLSKTDKKMIERALEFVGISHLKNTSITKLSGGQKQLVFLARSLAQDTPIILLDEPTSALDFKNQILLCKILKQLAKTGKCIFFCTHDINHVLWFCDEVVAFKNGEILAYGDVKSVINDEILAKIYGDICTLENIKDTSVAMPKSTSCV